MRAGLTRLRAYKVRERWPDLLVVDGGHTTKQLYDEPVCRDYRRPRISDMTMRGEQDPPTICRVDSEHVVGNIIGVGLVGRRASAEGIS